MQTSLQTFRLQIIRFQGRVDHCKLNALQDPVWDTYERAAIAILLSGAMERFLRDVVEAYVGLVCAKVGRFDQLPERMRRHHYEGGASYLLDVARRERKRAGGRIPVLYTEALDICRKLASSDLTGYHLVWEAFVDTQANPGPQTVKDLLSRLDVVRPWETVESNVQGVPYRGLAKGGALGNKLNSDLHELMEARNRCAHGMAESAAPAYSAIEEFLVSLEAIACGVVGALDERLRKL